MDALGIFGKFVYCRGNFELLYPFSTKIGKSNAFTRAQHLLADLDDILNDFQCMLLLVRVYITYACMYT